MSKISRDTNRQDARFIVGHQLFIGAFKAVEQAIVSSLKSSDTTELSNLQAITIRLQLLEEIKDALTAHISTGDIADFNAHLSNKVR